METHGFDPALCNNHLNPACSPLWLNAIVGACTSVHVWYVLALLAVACICLHAPQQQVCTGITIFCHCHHTCHCPKNCAVRMFERSPVACAPPSADRGVRMFERDKNSPAILLWSLGNESGGQLLSALWRLSCEGSGLRGGACSSEPRVWEWWPAW